MTLFLLPLMVLVNVKGICISAVFSGTTDCGCAETLWAYCSICSVSAGHGAGEPGRLSGGVCQSAQVLGNQIMRSVVLCFCLFWLNISAVQASTLFFTEGKLSSDSDEADQQLLVAGAGQEFESGFFQE